MYPADRHMRVFARRCWIDNHGGGLKDSCSLFVKVEDFDGKTLCLRALKKL
jgi:hypothetical protein